MLDGVLITKIWMLNLLICAKFTLNLAPALLLRRKARQTVGNKLHLGHLPLLCVILNIYWIIRNSEMHGRPRVKDKRVDPDKVRAAEQKVKLLVFIKLSRTGSSLY